MPWVGLAVLLIGRFVAVAADPSQADHVIAASARAVHETFDGGRSWQERFRVPAQTAITAIAHAPGNPPVVLAATDNGLYGSFDGGERWQRLFRGAGEGQAACTHVAFHPSEPAVALLGTRGGLFISRDRGQHWAAVNLPADARDVRHVAFDPAQPERVYVLAAGGLFAGSLPGDPWQQLAASQLPEETAESSDADAPEEPDASALALRSVAVHPTRPSTLYLGTSRGVRLSQDGGATWSWMPGEGLRSPDVSRVLLQAHSPVVLYAATTRGVARYNESLARWEPLAAEPAEAPIADVSGTARELWAATEAGVLRYGPAPDPLSASEPVDARALLSNFVHEPSIGQVREAAIRYAEVHPEKIRRWRRQAALKALLPDVNIGFDRDSADNVHVDEGTFPNFQVFETTDRDASLDVSVTWQLGELIWNDDQTGIDTRSKLMVQLRDDIVNEVTRTYFERRRLQVALLTEPPANDRLLLDKELRIQELTALIDGLTGGDFSERTAGPTNNGRW